ncbi:uncharacterized protein LOC128552459 [Mercenaria mercenaria]|uniref:uncharacterized protein LOC128552459 n=1 Tax=Mercenaria mercenaria TaxID=6596 RepID=UPI00234E8FBA|nr:uncharacterized protein LOC128552459 [Mercenaria mercenaria]
MEARYFACYKEYDAVIVLPLLRVTGRFIKIQMVGQTDQLSFCEVEIYGQTAGDEPNVNSTDCYQNNQVDGGFSSWSKWSPCSNKCGNGIRSRKRSCNNPLPKYGGRDCFGEKKEIQACFGSCPVCSDTLGKCYSVFPSMSVWNNARYDCWKRHMRLVSIFSIEELRFIKTLLRERRFLDGDRAYSLFNVSFYAHIGLRFVSPDIELFPIWENQILAHFLAWKPGEPSTRSCTRMNFQRFTEDNTWETVDCEVDLAEYFICEDQLKGKNKGIALYIKDIANRYITLQVDQSE